MTRARGYLWIAVFLILWAGGTNQWYAGQKHKAHGAGAGDAAVFVPPPPFIQAEAAVLFDLDSGKLLYAHNGFVRFSPGALAKVLAASTALRRGRLDDEVRIAKIGPTSGLNFGLTEGEHFTLEDLLRMMLFRPEHDPGVAIAIHVAGSIEAFSRQMNAQARRIGATRSHFGDPNGADGDRSYSTAFDLGWIARDALLDRRFAGIVQTPYARISRRGQSRTVFNMNSFLIRRPDATGVKTAFAPDRGYSLIGTGMRNGRLLLVVVLGSPTAEERFLDAQSLLEYGLAYFDLLNNDPWIPKIHYEIRSGDTLTGLAERFEVPMTAILNVNSMDNPDSLQSGQKLWIPR